MEGCSSWTASTVPCASVAASVAANPNVAPVSVRTDLAHIICDHRERQAIHVCRWLFVRNKRHLPVPPKTSAEPCHYSISDQQGNGACQGAQPRGRPLFVLTCTGYNVVRAVWVHQRICPCLGRAMSRRCQGAYAAQTILLWSKRSACLGTYKAWLPLRKACPSHAPAQQPVWPMHADRGRLYAMQQAVNSNPNASLLQEQYGMALRRAPLLMRLHMRMSPCTVAMDQMRCAYFKLA